MTDLAIFEPLVNIEGHDVHPEESVQKPKLNKKSKYFASSQFRPRGILKLL